MQLDKRGIAAYKKVSAQKKVSKKSKPVEAKVINTNPTINMVKPAPEAGVDLRKGSRKAAELLLLMGKDEAANVLKHMPIADVEKVIKELAEIKQLKHQDLDETLEKFEKDTETMFKGGKDVAKGFLKVAFGEEESERILQNAIINQEKPFSFLEELDTEQLKNLLKDESIETLAVILPRIKPHLAKEILKDVSIIYRTDLIKRIANTKKIDGSIIVRIESILKERLERQGGKIEREDVDGRKALAEMLRYMSKEETQQIMEQLPIDLASEIEDYTFNETTLLLIIDRDFQDILFKTSEQDIALLLKGQDEIIRAKFQKNVSEGKWQLILKEESLLPPMRKSEVDKNMREFLDTLKNLEQKGKITLLDENEEFL